MSAPARHAVRLPTLLAGLYRHISPRRRYQGVWVLALTLASSVAEVVSLGAVVPFIGILTQPDRVFASPTVARLAHAAGITSAAQLVLPLTVAFALAALLAGGIRVLMLWASIRLANDTGTDLSLEVYRRTLFQPYRVHVARNTSEVISGITLKVSTVTIVLTSLIGVVTSAVLFSAIMFTLLAFNPGVAAAAMLSFGVSYGIIGWRARRRLLANSQSIAMDQTSVVKSLQEGLGAIRDVLLDGTQAVYCDAYGKAVRQLQLASGENTYINQAPRYAMESLGMMLVAALAYALTRDANNIGSVLPLLGALALGAQRLLPLLQLLYGNWAYVQSGRASLADVLELLDQPLPDGDIDPTPAPLVFRESIRFDNVAFRYASSGPWILDGINLTVKKGARIGIVGSTGSGKSTALDLLMSLLETTQGQILVDGQPIDRTRRRAWQRAIAHVPQTIFLADSSIAENIAFGVPPAEIDMARVRDAAKRAQIADFIEGRSGGYDAVVGERGISLSGGQRQRIGIARALYKQATVLIFDEATNALDNTTEQAVMTAIEALNRDLTIFFVAHRLSTLQHCDIVLGLDRGKIVAQGTYEELITASSGFQEHSMIATAH